ncbi:MAG: hypothetical protein M3Q18_10360, partial [Actinomycetota bacterium]|nr:hypothetical protein [Actinomycetota bacterium]
RPELFEKYSGWGAGLRNYTNISLSPLTDAEIAQLISALLSQAVLPAEIHAAVLERAGGNPLYAEEFIRMLSDRGVLQQKGRTLTLDPDADIPMPDNIQALIAARLDTLSPERKSLLHNAAVVGKVFWSGAVAAIGEIDDAVVKEGLHELVRKELVRPARVSSMEGQQEYSFWHTLVRDVAYSQIPRAERGRKHRGIAEWVETTSGDRVSDHAEVLAHHYLQALDLARVTSDSSDVDQLSERAQRFLVLAGDRALSLDTAKADHYYRRALELMSSGDAKRPQTLVKAGVSARLRGRLQDAKTYLEQAIDGAAGIGDARTQGLAMTRLFAVLWWQGDVARSEATIQDALTLLEGLEPGPELAGAYASAAGVAQFSGRPRRALELATGALEGALRSESYAERVHALALRGAARCEVNDLQGLEDLNAAVDAGLKYGLTDSTSLAYSHLVEAVWRIRGAADAERVYLDYLDFCDRRGLVGDLMFARAENQLRVPFEFGRWDDVERDTVELLEWSAERKEQQTEVVALLGHAQVLVWRGHREQASGLRDQFMPLARSIGQLQTLVPALAITALIEQSNGHLQRASSAVAEIGRITREDYAWRARYLTTAVRVLVATSEVEETEAFTSGIELVATRDHNCALTGQAILAEAKGQVDKARNLYQEAVRRWAYYGFMLEEGQAHLGLARCLIALGDREAATDPLHKARAIFKRLGAVPLINETDSYLQAEAAS